MGFEIPAKSYPKATSGSKRLNFWLRQMFLFNPSVWLWWFSNQFGKVAALHLMHLSMALFENMMLIQNKIGTREIQIIRNLPSCIKDRAQFLKFGIFDLQGRALRGSKMEKKQKNAPIWEFKTQNPRKSSNAQKMGFRAPELPFEFKALHP